MCFWSAGGEGVKLPFWHGVDRSCITLWHSAGIGSILLNTLCGSTLLGVSHFKRRCTFWLPSVYWWKSINRLKIVLNQWRGSRSHYGNQWWGFIMLHEGSEILYLIRILNSLVYFKCIFLKWFKFKCGLALAFSLLLWQKRKKTCWTIVNV